MKYSTGTRTQAVCEMALGALSIGMEIYAFRTGNALYGIAFALPTLASPALFADGLYDLIHGTHHELPQLLYLRWGKDETQKKKIRKEIVRDRRGREDEMPDISVRETLEHILEKHRSSED